MTMAIGDTVTGGTQGSVLFVGSSSVLAQSNSNFFWNNSTQSLGIGTSSPTNDLTVRKTDTGTVGIDVINTNTTSGAANAQVFIQVAGPNGGDAVTVYEVFQGARWIVGIDNSESDKFKFVAVTTGPQLSLAMTTDGKVGVNVNDPTARLHLPAGTASLAPLKLTEGTNLTSPEAGAVEWDGNQLHITQTSGPTRRLLAFVDTGGASSAANHYSTNEFTWTNSSAFGSGAISGTMTHGLTIGDPRVIFRPEDYGGVYNNATVSAAQANTSVIETIKAAMPDTGGIIELRDEFFVYGTIESPRRPYINLNVGNVTDNGSGLIRISVPTNPPGQAHGLITGDRVTVSGVGGVTNANGEWTVVVTDPTFFDLVGSTFAGTYTSGGTYAMHRPIPFGIVGSAPGRSVLVNVQEDVPAIEWTGRYAPWVPSGVALFTLRDLIVISQGPGIRINPAGGSGQLQFSNVEAAHCKGYGWSFEQMYGFAMWNCRALLNHAEGFKFVSSVLWPSTLTAMWNRGPGVYASGTHVNGHFHVEGNESWGLDFDGVSGDLNVWQEGNRYYANYEYKWINSRLRRCQQQLRIGGQTLDDIDLGFDMDDISKACTIIHRHEAEPIRLTTLEPYDLGLPAMGTNAGFAAAKWQSGFQPSVVRDGETLHIDVAAGTYNHVASGYEGNAWIELFPLTLDQVTFDQGDAFEFIFTIELDAAAGDFFYTNRDDAAYGIHIAINFGPFSGPPFYGQYLRPAWKSGGKKRYRLTATANTNGDGARLFLRIPEVSGSGNIPNTAHRITITNERIARIPVSNCLPSHVGRSVGLGRQSALIR